jgi:thiol:disulfide interchange protein
MLGALLMPFAARAQKVDFAAKFAPADARAGEGAQIVVTAKIPAGFHMYSLTQKADGGVALKLEVTGAGALTPGGKPVGSAFKKVPEPILSTTLEEYTGSATFAVPVTVKPGIAGSQKAAVHVQYQICDERRCLPPAQADIPVTFSVQAGAPRANRKKPLTILPGGAGKKTARAVPAYPGTFILAGGPPNAPPVGAGKPLVGDVERSQSQGLLPFLLGAIAAGFTSLLTPCVFPMIPITVSFFTKRKGTEKEGQAGRGTQGIRGALAYCLGIIGTFTGLGLLTTVLFGATGIQNLAANPYVNMGLGILFVVLAANLMGAFEIVLPAGLLNRTQNAQSNGGLIAPLLMGLTFTLTSFTCTSPFVGTVLLAAAHGHYFYPFVGMLGFSTAFALPFFLLALFPQTLARMPKSGSWLVTVKAFMGFLELAAALKFFSGADLTWGSGILTLPVFLAIWAGIAAVAGFYLLGWLRLPHDDKVKVGIVRRILGVLTVIGSVYCLAAIEGRSLGELDSFLPPSPYPYHNVKTSKATPVLASQGTPETPFTSFEEAVIYAKQQNKPLFIDFTGYNCVNCRKMELTVFKNETVKAEREHYVNVQLYTDGTDEVSHKNQQLELKLAQNPVLPTYTAVMPDGATVVAKSEGYDPDASKFVAFLRKGRGMEIVGNAQ